VQEVNVSLNYILEVKVSPHQVQYLTAGLSIRTQLHGIRYNNYRPTAVKERKR
jgi:hypothetical protein